MAIASIEELLRLALATGDDRALRAELVRGSGLPGPRMNLRLVADFAGTVGDLVTSADPPVQALESLLDGWAALPAEQAPGDAPEVILPSAAVAAYGEVGAVRPDWWHDEIGKLRRAAADDRWRVREVVAQAVQRLLGADWDRTARAVLEWASADDPLVVRAAAAAVAEPPLLAGRPQRAAVAAEVQRRALRSFAGRPAESRRTPPVRVLRQGLGFTVSVVVAETADFALLAEAAGSDDPDLRWIARENLKKSRLRRWPAELDRMHRLLAG